MSRDTALRRLQASFSCLSVYRAYYFCFLPCVCAVPCVFHHEFCWSFRVCVWERRGAQPAPPSTDARLGTMIPANPAVDVHGCAQGTEYKHSFGSKPPVMPPAGPTHGRLITDASSSYRIGLPDPGLAPAAAIPKWASPLYTQKSPASHWAPSSTDITGKTPPPSFANIFMYKSIPAANLR